MRIGEILYGLITLLFMFLIMFSPLIRKMLKEREDGHRPPKKPEAGNRFQEDPVYESADSHRVVERALYGLQSAPKIKFEESKPLTFKNEEYYREKVDIHRRIDRVSRLKKAVIWKEILDLPVALREPGSNG
ncbi:MAG: hypothetical protein GY786_01945 [Proteobacteria bacterium]|nr:hypothetical protein [Pseudomonadota bacterium]